jgi:hypothetical protein
VLRSAANLFYSVIGSQPRVHVPPGFITNDTEEIVALRKSHFFDYLEQFPKKRKLKRATCLDHEGAVSKNPIREAGH